MFLRRLKKAIQEQNWFAVVLEIVIVVLGVVIGFQITAWAERQADLKTERSYLNQIASDISTTQRLTSMTDNQLAVSELSAAQLFDSFRKIDPLPDDSVLVLISNSYSFSPVKPILGTMAALINTGDLTLIRNDSLRLEIPLIFDGLMMVVELQKSINDELRSALGDLSKMVDIAEANAVEERSGGTLTVPSPRVNTSDPNYSTNPPFPFSASEFRNSFEAYTLVYRIHHWKTQAKMLREGIASLAGKLGGMISRELSK